MKIYFHLSELGGMNDVNIMAVNVASFIYLFPISRANSVNNAYLKLISGHTNRFVLQFSSESGS